MKDLNILLAIIGEGGKPSEEQHGLVNTLIAGPDPLNDLIEVANNPIAPIEVRNWCWNILTLTSLPKWWFRSDHISWLDQLPVPLGAQTAEVADLIDLPRIQKPKQFSVIGRIPTDSLERVWQLLDWRLEYDLHHFHKDEWGSHIIAGALVGCCTQAPNSLHYYDVATKLQGVDYELFKLVSWFIHNGKIPHWVRGRFISVFLDAGPKKLPDDYSVLDGLGNQAQYNDHIGTVRYAYLMIRPERPNNEPNRWTPEQELCLEQFFYWLWETEQLDSLVYLVRAGIYAEDVLKTLYSADEVAFKEVLRAILTRQFNDPESRGPSRDWSPETLRTGFLVTMRSIALHINDEESISYIDPLLAARLDNDRSDLNAEFERRVKSLNRDEEELKQMTEAEKARHELITGFQEVSV